MSVRTSFAVLTFLFLNCLLSTLCYADDSKTAAEVYRARIMPLLQSSNRSSCSECHLQGIELSDFLSEDQAQTFTDLRKRGWIDIDQPTNSKLLEFIRRQPANNDPLLQKVREAELAALSAWITAAVADPQLLSSPVKADTDLDLPLDFIRHARTDQITARFCEAIWSQLGRCANCHSPDRNQQQVEKNGEQMSWIIPNQPEATIKLLVDRGLIDIDNPQQSELRTKPLVLVKHGGGPKFLLGSNTDRKWLEFLQDYSKLASASYKLTDKLPGLPARRSWLSDLHLKLTELPADWKGRLLTVSVHAKRDGRIEELPVAMGESSVHRQQLVWQNQLTIFSVDKSNTDAKQWETPLQATESLAPGRYVLQLRLGPIVIDENQKPVQTLATGRASTLVATAEIDAPWPAGYQPPKLIGFGIFKQLD